MAGGIFVDQPFHLNPKCIIFSFYSTALYLFSGSKNPLLISLVFIISYILLSWYDYIYNCDNVMKSGTGPGPTALMKPQYRKSYDNQEKMYLRKVYLFHSIIIAPIMIYIGIRGKKTPSELFGLLGGLGGMASIYHSYRIYYPR